MGPGLTTLHGPVTLSTSSLFRGLVNLNVSSKIIIFFFLIVNVYLFLRERERERETECERERDRERERERETESEAGPRLQALSCRHRVLCGAPTHGP